MVGLWNNGLARVEGARSFRGTGYGQIADAHIHPDDVGVLLGSRLWRLDGERDQQVELLVGLVIPEPGRSNLCPMLDQFQMLVVAGVGHDDPSRERQDADVLLFIFTEISRCIY
jgi:hypothetical protein